METSGSSIKFKAITAPEQPGSSKFVRYQCVTFMKDYGAISFEELRWTDYQKSKNLTGFQTQTTATPFGQPQLFGNTSSTFGTTNAFGTSSAPIFGQTQTTPLFGSSTSTAPAFGQPQTGFGAPLFGQQQQQQPSGGLFSSPSSFSQQNKPAGFGFGSTPSTGLFGQPAQQQSSSLFQTPVSTNVFGGSGFGSNIQTGVTGTVVKFVPVTGTDSMQRSGIAHTISTKHHCITIMKEYETKSFEELRWEDYQASRKGPQQQTAFGAPQPFGATASSAPTLFGPPDQNKSVFGQSSGFGQNTGFGVAQPSTQTMFGKPASSGFGATITTASSFGFGSTPSTNLFATPATKPFGTQPTPNLFGQSTPAQQPAFGSNIFGQTSTQNNTLFGKPSQPTFGSTPGFQFGQTNPTQSTGLFQAPKPTTGFGFSFGQTATSTAPFGQTQTQQQPFSGFSSSFGKPFGQPQQQTSGFGTGLGMQSGTLFGNTAPKPGGLFSTGTGTGLFASTFQPTPGFGVPQQPHPQQAQLNQSTEQIQEDLQKLVSHYDLYGNNTALAGLEPIKAKEIHYATNPKDIQEILDIPPPVQRITPQANKINVLPPKIRLNYQFDEQAENSMEKSLYMRTGTRRLALRKKPTEHENRLDNLVTKYLYKQHGDSTEPSLTMDANKSNDSRTRFDGKEAEVSYVVPSSAPKATKPMSVPKQKLFTSDLSDNEPQEVYEDAVESPEVGGESEKKIKKKKQLKLLVDSSSSTQEYTPSSFGIRRTSLGSQNIPVDINHVLKDNKLVSLEKSCGVILHREGYYTIPPLDQLHEFKNEEGRCVVSGLTIGRLGYGNVYFPSEIDITDMNLDELVIFQHRMLTIFPDDFNKHPLGTGLNQDAQVTLDAVFPKDKRTGEEVMDGNSELMQRFVNRLRRLTIEKFQAEFQDYRPDTGSWVFTVKHFSRYGFLEDDSSDDEGEANQAKDKEKKGKEVDKDKKGTGLDKQKKATETESSQENLATFANVMGEQEMSSQFFNVSFGGIAPPQRDHRVLTLNIGSQMDPPPYQVPDLSQIQVHVNLPPHIDFDLAGRGFALESDYELERSGISQFSQRGRQDDGQNDAPDSESLGSEQFDHRFEQRRSDMARTDLGRSDVGIADMYRSGLHRSDMQRSDLQRSDMHRSDMHRPVSENAYLMKTSLFQEDFDNDQTGMEIDIQNHMQKQIQSHMKNQTQGFAKKQGLTQKQGQMHKQIRKFHYQEASSKDSSINFEEPMVLADQLPAEAFRAYNNHKLINPLGYVPPERSLLSGRNYMDVAMFKGRSMKCGWKGDGTLYSLPFRDPKGQRSEYGLPISNLAQGILVQYAVYDPIAEGRADIRERSMSKGPIAMLSDGSVSNDSNVLKAASDVTMKDSSVSLRESNASSGESNVLMRSSEDTTRGSDITMRGSDVTMGTVDGAKKASDITMKTIDGSKKGSDVTMKTTDGSKKDSDVSMRESNPFIRSSDVSMRDPSKDMKVLLRPGTRTIRDTSRINLKPSSVSLVENAVFTREILEKHMKVVLRNSKIRLVDDTPCASIKKGKMLMDHCLCTLRYPDSPQGNFYLSIWNLMVAFWGEGSKPANRKERFSEWLEDIVEQEVNKDMVLTCTNVDDTINNIFTLLSGHQVEKAAELAMNNNMPQLGLLISQINSGMAAKYCLNKQVGQWVNSMASDKIETNVFKLYLMLAGITNTEQANTCENLDWKRALAMHLWYIAPASKPISYVLELYKQAFQNFGYASRPNPPYFEEESTTFSILYHIMLLHINKTNSLEWILTTKTHTNDPRDYCLIWLLLVTFESLQVGTISDGCANHIHLNFASQLEGMGFYKWAIFVLQFIKDHQVRKKLIMGVLYRHIDITDDTTEDEEYELVKELKVSPVWIHHIKANKCLALKRYWEAYKHLSFTMRWVECHDIAIQYLIPTLMANEQYDEMKSVLYPISSGADKIPDWRNQGGLVLEFLQLQDLEIRSEQDYKERYLDVNEEIVSIIRRFSDFPATSADLSLCVSEMSRKSIHLLSSILECVSPSYHYLSESAKYNIGDLVMPTDYKIELLLSVLRKYCQDKCSRKQ